MKSPLYWSGGLYSAGIGMMHGQALRKRYRHIASLAGERVLDVGCGTALLADYLSEEDSYLGIDLNEDFLRHAKRRGRNVLKQDALAFDRFSEFDVCVIMDLLHHLNPRHGEFLERVLRDVRKRVIICEPFEVPGRHPLTKNLVRIADADGINRPEEWMDKAALWSFYESFGPIGIEEIGQALIAVYDKSCVSESFQDRSDPTPVRTGSDQS
ncbi:MAG TPA: class I SAM-dependent methyltransferase [Methanocella sp.]|nr:class I SAM-dependent methyltransferase [Methanocella sp.]